MIGQLNQGGTSIMRALDIPQHPASAPGLPPHAHPPAAPAALPQLPTHLPRWAWRRRSALLLQVLLLALEGGWSTWGLDLTLLLLLLAASAACTAPTLLLLPFVAWGMAAPTSVRRSVCTVSKQGRHTLFCDSVMLGLDTEALTPQLLSSPGPRPPATDLGSANSACCTVVSVAVCRFRTSTLLRLLSLPPFQDCETHCYFYFSLDASLPLSTA